MKAKQIKDIKNRLLKSADRVCNDEDQKRSFLQGARQMAHALSMNNLISMDDKHLIVDPIETDIQKILDEAHRKANQS